MLVIPLMSQMNGQLDAPEDQEDELVYKEGDLTWGSVATAIGADESIHHLRGFSSRSRALDKGKGVQTTLTSSSRTWTLIDEKSEEKKTRKANQGCNTHCQ